MSYWNKDTLQAELDRLNQTKKAVVPVSPWTNDQPQQLTYKPEESQNANIAEAIMGKDQAASDLAGVKAQNRYNYNQLKNAQTSNKKAHDTFVTPSGGDGKGGNSGSGWYDASGKWISSGVDNFDFGGTGATPSMGGGGSRDAALHLPGKIKKYVWKGHALQLNSTAAPHFLHFLNTLYKQGYHPKTIGSIANRNVQGTNRPSFHNYGLAIDIDAGPGRGQNNVYYDGKNHHYALPKNVGALAAKYGLTWGGNWKHKKDYMHFSYGE